MEKQNKFSDMMPEAARLSGQTNSASSSWRTEERIFKHRQKQRASPLTGKKADGNAVSQNTNSSVRKYSFIFIPCYCRKACGPPDSTTGVPVYRKEDNLLSAPSFFLPVVYLNKRESLNLLI